MEQELRRSSLSPHSCSHVVVRCSFQAKGAGVEKKSSDWSEVLSSTLVVDAKLPKLDVGERDAIVLVEELSADRLIVDATN
jgi:predicted nucleic acid-binding protein